MSRAALEALADDLKIWFPAMQGRVLPVAEIDPFTTANKPTLPLVTIGLERGTGIQGTPGSAIETQDDISIVFLLKSERYARKDQAESPFFSFYDYEGIRDTLLFNMKYWRSPRGAGATYRRLDVEADEFAVYLAFTFRLHEKWCDRDVPEGCQETETPDGRPLRIAGAICAPRTEYCGPIDEAKVESPCPPLKAKDEA